MWCPSMTKPVAYLILAHADPEQCTRLIRSLLADRDAHVFLHLDLNAKSNFSSAVALDATRVHFVQERYAVAWAGYSMVKGIMAAMREALVGPVDFGYLVLLSGMDYPTRHPEKIKEYLYNQPFKQHINRLNVADSPEHYVKVARRFIFIDPWLPAGIVDKIVRKAATIALAPFKRKLPAGMMCTGSSWWALTPEFGRYFLQTAGENEEFERYYKFLMSPEEYCFHTVLQNSPFVDEAPPVLPYQGRGMWRTANLHLIHPSLRKIYTEADFEEVMAANRCFVRKVNTAASSRLLDQIDGAIGLTPVR
jgi:hypothetical protein